MASAPSLGAMKVVVLCDLADQDQAPSSVREVAKARQIKARVSLLRPSQHHLKEFLCKKN